MRPADSWRDYELLDATNHNRLERWGQTLLIRPDPQVIWKNDEASPLWARADAVYYRSAKGGGQWNYHKRFYIGRTSCYFLGRSPHFRFLLHCRRLSAPVPFLLRQSPQPCG